MATPSLVFAVVVVCLNAFAAGFGMGSTAGVVGMAKSMSDLSDLQREILSGGLELGAIFGSLSNMCILDRIGRRLSFTGAAALVLVGFLLQLTAVTYWEVLTAGRAIMGVGIGTARIASTLSRASMHACIHALLRRTHPPCVSMQPRLLASAANHAFLRRRPTTPSCVGLLLPAGRSHALRLQ